MFKLPSDLGISGRNFTVCVVDRYVLKQHYQHININKTFSLRYYLPYAKLFAIAYCMQFNFKSRQAEFPSSIDTYL